MLITLLFMYIFRFKLFEPGYFFNSSMAISVLLGIFFVTNKKYRINTLAILLNRKIFVVFSFLVVIIFYSFFITTALLEYDYSIITTFLNQLISLFTGVLIYSLYVSKNKIGKLGKHIIYIFIIQSMIQLISFLNPEINDFFNIFRNESAIEKGQLEYGNIRGLALSGYAFFGLAASYGLIYIYYFHNWGEYFQKKGSLKYLFLILLIFGGLSAGRTALVGILIGILDFIFISVFIKRNIGIREYKIRVRNIFYILLLGLVFVIGYNNFLKDDSLKIQTENYKRYSLEFVYNLIEKGELSTRSTDVLFNDMYFPVESRTFLIGDGKYTNENGTYYMHTDSGYMRNILFFGIIGIIILFIYQINFFVWRNISNKDLALNVSILLYLIILHVKGEIIGFLIITQNILFLLLILNLYNNKLKN